MPQPNNNNESIFSIHNPCPSCKASLSYRDAKGMDYWKEVKDKCLRCPNCGAEVAQTQSVWPFLFLVGIMLIAFYVDAHINQYMQPLSEQAKAVIRWIRPAITWMPWIILGYSGFMMPIKPYWKLVTPKADKNNN